LRDARHEDIAKYRATQQKLAEIAPKLATQRQELEDNRTKLIAQRNELGEEQKQRQSTVTQLNRDIANQQQKLNQLKKDQSQLEGVLKTLQEAIANMAIPSDFAPFSSRLGKLRWPVDGKRQNTFGSSRGAEINWQGISISGREGSAVKSIHSGRVVFADWLKGYGLLMIIDHGEDYLSLYAHNQSLLKGLGDWINPGEAIATVGKSGGKDDASVYFEIRHAGKAVDPARWCK
jgi:septal ring factor EnvC (AmiA/AmiB activator)